MGVMIDQRLYFRQLFEVSYSVAKPGRPFAEFVHIIELDKLHGVNFSLYNSLEKESACSDQFYWG